MSYKRLAHNKIVVMYFIFLGLQNVVIISVHTQITFIFMIIWKDKFLIKVGFLYFILTFEKCIQCLRYKMTLDTDYKGVCNIEIKVKTPWLVFKVHSHQRKRVYL